MALILPELKEKLLDIDEITLLERLDINSEELVERFTDKIEDRFDSLMKEFDNVDSESQD